jgi:ribose transport system permease protein
MERSGESAFLLALLALVLVVGGVLVPHVFQVDNITNVLRSSSIVGLVAIGMTFVLLTGEIDLSVGSIMSLSLVIGGEFVDDGGGLALAATGLCGLALGVINGIAVGYGRVNSLIMTLGTLAIYGGVANVVARGQAVYLYDSPAYSWTGKGTLLGLPFPLFVFVAACVIGTVVLARTRFGRQVYYTGASNVAAWYSGVNVARTKVLVFAVSGLLAALAGPLLASQTNRITPTLGVGYELAAIAIAALGGTALDGARGTVIGTMIGALIYGFLLNVLSLSGVSTYTEQVLKGCLLILVVLLFQRLVFRKGLLGRLRLRSQAAEA